MARITVEDCLEKVNNQYELVLLAKERTSQLNAGDLPLVPEDNDKKTVIALREIGEGKVLVDSLEDSAVNKLRKNPEGSDQAEESGTIQEDDFENIYKGEISKSGTPILPSKRARKIPEKLQVSKEDIDQLKGSNDRNVDASTEESSEVDVSLDELSESETKEAEANPEDTEATNS